MHDVVRGSAGRGTRPPARRPHQAARRPGRPHDARAPGRRPRGARPVPRLIAPDAAPFARLPFDVVPDLVAAGALGALYTALATVAHAVRGGAGRRPAVRDRAVPGRAGGAARRRRGDRAAAGGTLAAVVCGLSSGRRGAAQGPHRRGEWRVIDALEDLTVGAVSDADLAPFDPDGRLLLNVNTPDDSVRATGTRRCEDDRACASAVESIPAAEGIVQPAGARETLAAALLFPLGSSGPHHDAAAHDRLRSAIRTALVTQYGLDRDAASIPLETPPNRAFGDIGSPVAFELARELRKAPRVIAQELAAALGPIDGVTSVSAAPNGYLNVFLDRGAFLLDAPEPGRAAGAAARRPRRSSSTRPSTRTRPRTSGTCATPASATRWCGRCASAARRSKCRTTSTTPASRWPTSSSACAISSSSISPACTAIADSTRFDYYCWDLYARVGRVVRRRQGAAGRARRDAARDRTRRSIRRPPSAPSWPSGSCARTW